MPTCPSWGRSVRYRPQPLGHRSPGSDLDHRLIDCLQEERHDQVESAAVDYESYGMQRRTGFVRLEVRHFSFATHSTSWIGTQVRDIGDPVAADTSEVKNPVRARIAVENGMWAGRGPWRR